MLQDLTRSSINHAKHEWHKAISYNLWPYTMCMACEILNNTPSSKHNFKRTPTQMYYNTTTPPNTKHWQHFACPAYVLVQELQVSTQIFHKWKEQARLGSYLGSSPQHASTVSLILNLPTGHVSPQFHVKYDPIFETVRGGTDAKDATWKIVCGFIRNIRKTTPHTQTERHIQQDQQQQNKPPSMATPTAEGDTNTTLNTLEGWRSTRHKHPIDRLTYMHMTELTHNHIPGEIYNTMYTESRSNHFQIYTIRPPLTPTQCIITNLVDRKIGLNSKTPCSKKSKHISTTNVFPRPL